MNALNPYIIYTALIVLCLILFSRQILYVCLSLFVSTVCIVLALVSIVVCSILIIVVAIPTATFTCFVARKEANSAVAQWSFVQQMCDLKQRDIKKIEKY